MISHKRKYVEKNRRQASPWERDSLCEEEAEEEDISASPPPSSLRMCQCIACTTGYAPDITSRSHQFRPHGHKNTQTRHGHNQMIISILYYTVLASDLALDNQVVQRDSLFAAVGPGATLFVAVGSLLCFFGSPGGVSWFQPQLVRRDVKCWRLFERFLTVVKIALLSGRTTAKVAYSNDPGLLGHRIVVTQQETPNTQKGQHLHRPRVRMYTYHRSGYTSTTGQDLHLPQVRNIYLPFASPVQGQN
eukprot:3047227-Amphidinium_carterae.1